MEPYFERRAWLRRCPRDIAGAHFTRHRLAVAAVAATLLALLVAPSAARAQSVAGPTVVANATGGNTHDICGDGVCSVYDSNQAPGEPVTLDGSQSTPSTQTGSPITSYTWTVDGGANQTSASPTLAVNFADGNHTATLVVQDQAGNFSNTQTLSITVSAPSVAVIAGGNRTVADTDNLPGETVLVDGTQSTFGDCGANCTTTTYHWTINGQPSNVITATATFRLNDGPNTVSLVDDDGIQVSASTSVVITVGSPPVPTAAIAGGNRAVADTDGKAGEVVALDGSGSSAQGNASIVTYTWSVNGAAVTAAVGPKPSLNLVDGDNTVSLVVTDSRGLSSAPTSVTITVSGNVTVQIAGGNRSVADSDGLPGERVPFVGTVTTVGRTLPLSAFAWTATALSGGQPITADSANGTDKPTLRLRDGVNTVTLSVTDPAGGAVTKAVATITVADTNSANVPNPLSSIPGLTANQKSVARALEQSCSDLTSQYVAGAALAARPTDLLQQCRALIRDHVNAVDVPGLQTALDALSGQQVTGMQRIGLDFSDSQFKNLGDRLTELRRGSRGASASGLHVQAGDTQVPLQSLASLAGKAFGGGAGDNTSSSDGELLKDRLGIFVTGDLRVGDRAASGRESAFDLRDQSLTVGVDYRFTDSLVAGGAVGYGKAKSLFAAPEARLDSKNLTLSAYGSWYKGDWYVDFIGSRGKVDYDSSRRVLFTSSVVTSVGGTVDRTATGSTRGRQSAVSASTGYDWHWGGLLAGPLVTLSYSRLDIDGFDESGADGLNLTFDAQTGESFTLKTGGHMSYALSTRYAVLLPHVQASAVHEFAGSAQAVSAHFAADAAAGFTIMTDAPDRNYFNWSTGLSAQFPYGIAAFIDYQAMAGLALTKLHDTSMGIRVATRF
ncbi:MAG: autotransporter outer rane beta-barrel protein [Gammaproteobacteria bacterium]|nr:autotransporter outer rane beta-barrel protein [Gammaproteobacteria bacterium]